jgi:hypothetical protein
MQLRWARLRSSPRQQRQCACRWPERYQTPELPNPATSIRARRLNESTKSGESFQSLLVRYASERFLFRLGKSAQRDAFVLKGATLFVAWGGRAHRLTKDLDLLGFGERGQEDAARRIADIAAYQVKTELSSTWAPSRPN